MAQKFITFMVTLKLGSFVSVKSLLLKFPFVITGRQLFVVLTFMVLTLSGGLRGPFLL